MSIIKTTTNYIISFNADNNIRYVKSRINGKFAKHAEALEELKQLILKEKEDALSAFIGLSLCVISILAALSYMKFGISFDFGLIMVTFIVSILGLGYSLSSISDDINYD